MMRVDEIKKILEAALPAGSKVSVADMTGTMDHFQVEAVSEAFAGKLLIQQHRMVQTPLQPAITDERIHALTIKTYTPEEWNKKTDPFNIIN